MLPRESASSSQSIGVRMQHFCWRLLCACGAPVDGVCRCDDNADDDCGVATDQDSSGLSLKDDNKYVGSFGLAVHKALEGVRSSRLEPIHEAEGFQAIRYG